jgi:sporulation protein YhbH
MAVFRPYSPSDSLQSDRSSSDRQRHREKVREALRENIADVVAEQAIIGRSGDHIVKVPIRGIKEYQFVYGDNAPGAGEGDGETRPGQVIGSGQRGQGVQTGVGGDQPGLDYYETEVSIEELIDLMFEDLELPDMERKALRRALALRTTKRRGYKRVGVRTHLDKKRTAKSRIRRKIATGKTRRESPEDDGQGRTEVRFPYHQDDLRFRRRIPDVVEESNAVVFCLMDTSGSMDTLKKYLARSFFFLLYQFVRRRYDMVDLVFVAHDTKAREVSEEQFFSKGESGGTMISSGYEKLLEIIEARYHPSLWNIYAFHCSDGDNFPNDNPRASELAGRLCEVCKLFGYGEITPHRELGWQDSLKWAPEGIQASNFRAMKINSKDEVWPAFREFLSRERADEGVHPGAAP